MPDFLSRIGGLFLIGAVGVPCYQVFFWLKTGNWLQLPLYMIVGFPNALFSKWEGVNQIVLNLLDQHVSWYIWLVGLALIGIGAIDYLPKTQGDRRT